jgi:hypothetical protein
MESVKKKRDMDYFSYDLGGFVGTIPEHAARQGLSPSTVRSRKARGWKLSEALGYAKRAGGDNPSILIAPRRLAIEMQYGKLFDEVLADLQAEGLSINATAKRLEYDARALYRYLAKRPGDNPWSATTYLPVAARFKQGSGITIAAWLDLHASKYSQTQAASFLGYCSVTTMRSYLVAQGLNPVFRKQGKHAEHRGAVRNLSDHAAAAGIPIGTISARIHRGMTLHQALTTPVVSRSKGLS